MLSLLEPPLLSRLKRHDRILIAGAGGGFDVYAGLRSPWRFAALANRYSWRISRSRTWARRTSSTCAPHVAAVTAADDGR